MSNRRGCSGTAIVLTLAIIGLFAAAILLVSNQLIANAEAKFGLPSNEINSLERIQLALQLGLNGDLLLIEGSRPGSEQIFLIDEGESIDSILDNLQNSGLIQEAGIFRIYLIYSGLDRKLQAGEFRIATNANALEIAQGLLDPSPGHITLSVLAGWRLEEIAESLASAGFQFSQEEFMQAAIASADDFDFLSSLPEGKNLEGYFIAGNYEADREVDAVGLVHLLLKGTAMQLNEALQSGFAEQGLSVHEALTLASIVEREAVLEEEMARIASVFINRLAAGMRLEADPTVQYGLGFDEAGQNWWTNPLLSGHLEVDSEYNTYRVDGLPEGPIASPSMAALKAISQPEASVYYFFQAACDGSGKHVFAISYEEHLSNNCP